jgi:tetratricopeptide (TPR) repeat protein
MPGHSRGVGGPARGAVAVRNRGDAYRLAGRLDDAGDDLARALNDFREIGDRRWEARTQISLAGLGRLRREWDSAGQLAEGALEVFRSIGDRPAEARALREIGILLRDQGDFEGSRQALDGSVAIFNEIGDMLWTARVLAGKAALEGLCGGDPAPLESLAESFCHECGIAEEHIASALREW